MKVNVTYYNAVRGFGDASEPEPLEAWVLNKFN